MKGTSEHTEGPGLDELHTTLVKLVALAPDQRTSLIHDFVLHPAFQRRLQQACVAVFRQAARRRELQADVCQEATYHVIRSLDAMSLHYTDEGLDHFAGWLWTVLGNAVRQAKRRHLQQIGEARLLADPDAISRHAPTSSREPDSHELWSRVLVLIQEISDREVYEAMVDWAAGLKGVESAKVRGVSPSAISKRRKRGLHLLRRRLQDEH